MQLSINTRSSDLSKIATEVIAEEATRFLRAKLRRNPQGVDALRSLLLAVSDSAIDRLLADTVAQLQPSIDPNAILANAGGATGSTKADTAVSEEAIISLDPAQTAATTTTEDTEKAEPSSPKDLARVVNLISMAKIALKAAILDKSGGGGDGPGEAENQP